MPSFRADKRARIIIEGYLAAFRVSGGPYLYIIGKAIFDPHLLSQGLLLSILLVAQRFSWLLVFTIVDAQHPKIALFTSLE